MREAIGGAWLLYIAFVIIFIFIAFMVFVISYASTYRAANYVISQVETCEGNIDSCVHLDHGVETIKDDVKSKYYYTNGINITCKPNARGTVYNATLNVSFELPLIGKIGIFKINVESKTIYTVSECNNSYPIVLN